MGDGDEFEIGLSILIVLVKERFISAENLLVPFIGTSIVHYTIQITVLMRN